MLMLAINEHIKIEKYLRAIFNRRECIVCTSSAEKSTALYARRFNVYATLRIGAESKYLSGLYSS